MVPKLGSELIPLRQHLQKICKIIAIPLIDEERIRMRY